MRNNEEDTIGEYSVPFDLIIVNTFFWEKSEQIHDILEWRKIKCDRLSNE